MNRAVVFEGRERMRLVDMPRPQCGPGEVLLRVAACGICGGDLRSFLHGDFPGRIPGHEFTGVVEECGADAPYAPGDRLALAADLHCSACWYCRRELFNMCDSLRILGKHVDGGLAEYVLLTRDILEHGIVNRVPAGLGLLEAALSEPLCSVLATHDELAIEAGETVVVIGCGPMGMLHFELLRARGANVVMVGRTPARLERARRDFDACTVDASAGDSVDRIRAMTEGVGADVAICAAPAASAIAQSVWLVRKRGRIGVFGGLPVAEREVAVDMNRVHYGELSLVGNFSYHPRCHVRALELLASGRVRADKLITTYPMEETERALADLRSRRVLKAIVVPGGNS